MSSHGNGLGRNSRLRSGRELREISRECRGQRDVYFSVYARANNLGHARLGITVSRRVSIRAIIRNRIKRCIRESFRIMQAQLIDLDLVVVARPPAASAEPAALRRSLQHHWETSGLACKPC